ncbi:hypothetical protein C8Q78DRAFT_1022745 [Trametes maxima]|nr:hypothetical protein C8Q78DRAFT_1035467 [Trametes maxima]KAI0673104.1 hypothetical protein C8Q78DRAFT_1022745 [Trametes maxima]
MAGTRFVFYDDPPKGPHCSFINENCVRTNNVFAVDFDPCSSEPQATVIQPSAIVDSSKPLIVMFTPRHGVKCIDRTHRMEIHHPEVARVAKSGSRYWDMCMTCSDFNRAPFGSREVAIQTDPIEQELGLRSRTVLFDMPETKFEDDTRKGSRTVASSRSRGQLQYHRPIPVLQHPHGTPSSRAIDSTEDTFDATPVLNNIELEHGAARECASPVAPAPVSPGPAYPILMPGDSADDSAECSADETGSNNGWSQLPDTLEIIMVRLWVSSRAQLTNFHCHIGDVQARARDRGVRDKNSGPRPAHGT